VSGAFLLMVATFRPVAALERRLVGLIVARR